MIFDGRVLVCGSRDFGTKIEGGKRVEDPTSLEFHMIWDTLQGMFESHMVGFGSAYLLPFVVIEGDATGADKIAGMWATQSPLHPPPDEDTGYGCAELMHECYPANWNKHGKAAGPIRNTQMLVEGKPTLVLAFSNDFSQSRGTNNMIEQAKKADLPVVKIEVLK